jgi:bud site selection protein 31
MPRFPIINPPEGFEKLLPFLNEIESKMREHENQTLPDKRRVEHYWPIFKLHNQRSRFIYDMFFKERAISKKVYDYCLDNFFCDRALVSKWRKNGYENLCCLRCIQPAESKSGNVCICRVPKRNLKEDQIVECDSCGCKGCTGY